MAIVFTDGFDLYGTTAGSNLLTRWTAASGATPSSAVTPYGSGQSLAISVNGFVNYFSFPAQSSFTVGFAFRTTAGALGVPGSVNNQQIIFLQSSTTTMIGLQLNSDGSLQVNRQTSTTAGTSLGFTSANVIKTNTWYYIELAVSISDTVGTVRLDVDGNTLLNLTNQDTRNGTPTTIDTLCVTSFNTTTTTTYFDDMYISNTTTPLGPQRIYTLRPNLDTAQKDWTPLSGANNYSMVADTLTDGDTSYVQASTVGNYDLYDLGNLTPTSATISAINHLAWAKKTDVTTRAITLTTKSGATTTDSANIALSVSYVGYSKIYDTDPNTAGAWTVSGVNALQIGQKIAI